MTTPTALERIRQRAEIDAKARGYYLNPDPDFLRDLLEGLRRNEDRYGYPSCPCRLATGKLESDQDIVCPCDYRDADVEEYGNCYCALYVRKDIFEGGKGIFPIPERRLPQKQVTAQARPSETEERPPEAAPEVETKLPETRFRLWYCRQCGYVAFRVEPPYLCPICKAKREMFAEIRMRMEILG